jgi:hypothetical protein
MTFDELVGRIMHDEEFRTQLKADPEQALQRAGVTPTPQLVESLQNVDWSSIHQVANHYAAAVGISC